MPNPLQNPGPPRSYTFAVPYPAAAGALGPTIKIEDFMRAGSQSFGGPSPSPYSGAWVEINNDSDSALTVAFDNQLFPLNITPGQPRAMPIPRNVTLITTTIIYQNPYQVHPAQALIVNFFTPADIEAGHAPLQGGIINPSTPAAGIGPGPLPVGVSIGAGPESTSATFIGLQPTVTESGVFDATAGHTGIIKAFANIFFGVNNYFDGISDRYISSNPAYQLNFSRANGWRFRFSIDIVPTAGNVITWSAFELLVDTSGNRYADGPVINGDLAANQVGPGNLDTDVNLSGAIVSLGGQAAVGSFGAPVIIAQTVNQSVTVTSVQTLISITLVAGLYRISGAFVLNNGTLPQKPTYKFTYTSAGAGGSQGNLTIFTSATAFGSLDGVTVSISVNNTDWITWPQIFMAGAGTFTLTYQDPGGTPNDHVSAVLERLA